MDEFQSPDPMSSPFMWRLKREGLLDESSLASVGAKVQNEAVAPSPVLDEMFATTYSRLEDIQERQRIDRLVLRSRGIPRAHAVRLDGAISELPTAPPDMLRANPSLAKAYAPIFPEEKVTLSAEQRRRRARAAYGKAWHLPPQRWRASIERQLTETEDHEARRKRRTQVLEETSDGTHIAKAFRRFVAEREGERDGESGASR
eukprot:Amastigsp_a2209_55.p3 type:complete len:203 gc:universal Amastigsp_a2209_55:2214-1606(-)